MLTTKQIIAHLQADFSAKELEAIELIIEKIDDFLLNNCNYRYCTIRTDILHPILNEFEVYLNRYHKIKEYVCGQYQALGWTIKLEENYISFEIKQ